MNVRILSPTWWCSWVYVHGPRNQPTLRSARNRALHLPLQLRHRVVDGWLEVAVLCIDQQAHIRLQPGGDSEKCASLGALVCAHCWVRLHELCRHNLPPRCLAAPPRACSTATCSRAGAGRQRIHRSSTPSSHLQPRGPAGPLAPSCCASAASPARSGPPLWVGGIVGQGGLGMQGAWSSLEALASRVAQHPCSTTNGGLTRPATIHPVPPRLTRKGSPRAAARGDGGCVHHGHSADPA